ncbi:MAG: hypothetical protein AAFX94_23195, partial [Myxococcota bacterium]
DVDCGTGQVCVLNVCAEEVQPDVECFFSSDCPTDGDTCINATCHPSCGEDVDCANPRDFCDEGICRPDWRPVSECVLNTDCDEGEECVDGACVVR